MSQPTIVKAANDAAENVAQPAAATHVTHPTGVFESESTLVSNVPSGAPVFHQNVPDHPIGDFFARFVEIDSALLATTDTFGTSAVNDPWALYLANANVAEKLQNFSLIRADLELMIVSAVAGGCYGEYVFSALPDAGVADVSNDAAVDLLVANCLQVDVCGRLNCAQAENIRLVLPWMWPYDFAQLPTGPAFAWSLWLTCLSPLRSGTDVATVSGSCRIYARLAPGYQVCVPYLQGKERSGKLAKAKGMVDSLRQSKAISNTAATIAGLADKAAGIPLIGGAAAAVGAVAHGVAEVASWFGFTRAPDPRHPMPVTQRSVTNVANYDGMDASDVAALSVDQAISIDPTLVGGPAEDVAANASLFSRWTLIQKATWSPTNLAGEELFVTPVSPFYTAMASTANTASLPVAGYVGMPFNFWRGDMEYLIIIPVSKFHRGTLQVYWAPNSGLVGGDPITNVTMNVVKDISDGGDMLLSVGFVKDAPYLEKALITPDVTIQPITLTNGCIRGRVVNKLTSQNVTGAVDILIFTRAKANMDFAFMANSITYPIDGTGNVISDLSYGIQVLQGALGDEDEEDEQPVALVGDSGNYPGAELLWGEKFSSVRALMQKPCRTYYRSATQPVGRTLLPVLGVAPWGSTAPSNSSWGRMFTLASWYRALFVGVAASERYKFIPRGETMLGAAPIFTCVSNPTYTTHAIQASQLAPMTFCGPNRGAEITIPYYEAAKFMLGRRAYHPGTLAKRQNAMYTNYETGDTPAEVAVYHSFGPDIRLTRFRQVPQILFTGTASSTNQFWQY